MGKTYIAIVASAGLLLSLAASAEAGGRGRTPGASFSPPGFSNNTTGQTHSNWGTNSQTTVQPPGWTNNTTGQTHGWNSSIAPPGLNGPPGR